MGGAGGTGGGAGDAEAVVDAVTLGATGGGAGSPSAIGEGAGAGVDVTGPGPAAHAVDIAAMVTTIAPRDMRPSSISLGTSRERVAAQNGQHASPART